MQPLLDAVDAPPGWGEPTHVAAAGTTLMFFARPTRRDGELVGAVVATISVPALSRFIVDIDTPGEIGTFILYGRDRVMAHRALVEPGPLTTSGEPLPSLVAVSDPALALMWAAGWEGRSLARFGIEAHTTNGPDGTYVYLYEPLVAARSTPWLIGGYFRAEDIGREWQALNRATTLAGVLLLLSLLGAILLARKLARPATEIAATARAVSTLELDHIRPMRGSRIRELDDAERSLNAMVAALGCFVRYLPRDLVDYVLRHPDRHIGRPQRRPMTIMFTDISGFTTLAETLDPEAAGALLNEHFADLEASIRATGGVIDKYMGDGLLAFWGAPEPLSDHPRRAVEAALAMARAVRARNVKALIPLRLRVGIATGDILVGDLGAPTRTNYTVIGDAVNVAQRLLEMGHVAAPDHETVIVTTSACIARIAPEARPRVRQLGEHQVRGRHGMVELVEVLDARQPEPKPVQPVIAAA
jgi:adenylate cyclase